MPGLRNQLPNTRGPGTSPTRSDIASPEGIMRQLPEDPRDWTDEDIAFAQNWDVTYRDQLAALADMPADPTPSTQVADAAATVLYGASDGPEDPALGLPWLAPTPRDQYADQYDHWKLKELKDEAERREPPVTLAEGVDSRAKQPWIDALRDDDRRRMSGQG